MKTYSDFEWLFRDYPWTENGLHVTYVRDASPTTVIEAMTVRHLGEVRGLQGINEVGWEEFSIVGAAALGNWTIAIAPLAWAGSDDELMVPLSVGREVLTHSRSVEAASSFDLWQDGVHAVHFDPLFCSDAELNPMSEAWQSRMREVGLDPDNEGPTPDGKFHLIEASFAMAANYTGVQITPEFLSTSNFVAGSDD
ncbi:DUF6461 domain-containing protein [Rhodococcus erythropolis]|uniref:DUF6461 domain-containing protein n=1 Tax=Rhodococcus erythropolis TaxID=1833 RepID=UPI0029496C1D|nr:DUF6461 domain-containing protein [Rhodococcus erythropolis]MDV6211846.1 DUF6461 domain-containing protein [Rhodococcus erythropolis]